MIRVDEMAGSCPNLINQVAKVVRHYRQHSYCLEEAAAVVFEKVIADQPSCWPSSSLVLDAVGECCRELVDGLRHHFLSIERRVQGIGID